MIRAVPLRTMVLLGAFVLLGNFAFSTIGVAEEHHIEQNNIKFSNPLKVIKPGDSLVFTNRDTVVHNIVSLTHDFEFDLGIFKPGMSKSVTFKEPGVVDIQCTIHPDMKMTLFIFK